MVLQPPPHTRASWRECDDDGLEQPPPERWDKVVRSRQVTTNQDREILTLYEILLEQEMDSTKPKDVLIVSFDF